MVLTFFIWFVFAVFVIYFRRIFKNIFIHADQISQVYVQPGT